MARIASRIKLGFYPTPPPVARGVAQLLTAMSRDASLRLLDPCAGDGKALALIRQCLRERHIRAHGRYADCDISTWGIEPDLVRAQQAEQQLDHLLQTSFFSTTLSNGDGPDGGWQCAYVNPPYDEDTEGQGVRLEFQFLKRATEKLCTYGIMIWVIPQYVLSRRGIAKYLSEHYDQHTCYRFPDVTWRPPNGGEEVSMYEQFKQVIWIGRKRSKALPAEREMLAQIDAWGHMGNQLPALPLESAPDLPTYAIPNARMAEAKYFLKGAFDPDAAAAKIGTFHEKTHRPEAGVWANEDYWLARFPDPRKVGMAVGHPLHRFKKGYLIVFAIAGIVNQAVLTGKDGRRILVKGHTRKTTCHSGQDDDREIVEKQTDRFESSLWCTDLETMDMILVETGSGALTEWSVDYETMSMEQFLANFGDSLMEQVLQLNAPRYEGLHQIPWAKPGFAHVKRKPMGKQLDTILAQVHALVNRWRQEGLDEDEFLERIAEIAEMASGKTYIAIVTAFLADLYACGCANLATKDTKFLPFFPAIILSPPIMARKWKREIENTLPNARVLIVERFGPTRSAREDEDDDEDVLEEQSMPPSDAAKAFREFDPTFTGSALGTIGSVDRAVRRIQGDLAQWQRRYDRVAAENTAIRQAIQQGKATEEQLKPLPLKPCHVLVVTFYQAKMMPKWIPVYRMKPLRTVDPQDPRVKLLRQGDEEKGYTPVLVPACPHCFRAIKDERVFRRQPRKDGSYNATAIEKLQEERSNEGRKLGLLLLSYEERIRQYLEADETYRALLAERTSLQQGIASYDAGYAACEQRVHAFLERLRVLQPEYRALLREREQIGGADSEKLANCEQRIGQFLHHLLLTNAEYRALIIALDQRFRELQLACEERIEQYVSTLAEQDETYAALMAEANLTRQERAHHKYRVDAYEEETQEPIYYYLTEVELRGTREHRVQRFCIECGEALWQYVPKQPREWRPFSVLNCLPSKHVSRVFGESLLSQCLGSQHTPALPIPSTDFRPACVQSTYKRRYAIADYIADHYPSVFKLLIADEVHEGADGTALDQARQVLARTCRRMLGLTGTLSNGYASSLFRLFYVIAKQVRKEFGYDDVKRWIRQHGKMQLIQKSRYESPPTGTGSDSKRQINPGMPVYKEIPGFDASGMGRVARVSTFLELKDVVRDLVGYGEVIHTMKMGPELGPTYMAFQEVATHEMRQLLATGDNSGLSPWFYALLIYPAMPWLGFECKTKHGQVLGIAPPLSEDTVYPIEEAVIKYVQEQHLKGYPILIYTEQTGQYDEQPRLKQLLERYVRGRGGKKLRVSILRSTSTKKTMDREAWLERCIQDGVDVLICNPSLVKVGLDLIYFPRIVYKSFPRKTTDLRQSARRSLRPGQTQDVEVAFFAYEESLWLRLLYLMGRKTLASLMVEGKIPSEGLVSLGYEEEEEEGEIIGQLAREMVRELDAGTLADQSHIAEELQAMAKQAAEIERDQNQEIGEEEDTSELFLEAIRQEPLSLPPPVDHLEATQQELPLPGLTPVPDSSPTATEKYVTIIPVTITEDPLAHPIVVQAGEDAGWAALRAMFSVGGKKRGKGRRK